MRRRLSAEAVAREPLRLPHRSRSVEATLHQLQLEGPPRCEREARSVSIGAVAPRRLCRSVVDTHADHPLVWDTFTPAAPAAPEPQEEEEESFATKLLRTVFGYEKDRYREISDDFTPQLRMQPQPLGCTILPPLTCTDSALGVHASSRPTFIDEYKKTLRAYFSVSTGGEVELKEFSTTVREEPILVPPPPPPPTLTRTLSLRSFERMVAVQEETASETSEQSFTEPAVIVLPEEQPSFVETWRTKCVDFLRQYTWGETDERLVDTLRLQPFATGAYLRAMLLGGFVTGIVFHVYNLMHWNDVVAELRVNNLAGVEQMVWFWVFSQVVFACAQLPSRFNVYMSCWQVSRSADAGEAWNRLEAVARSDDWLICRALGWCIDVIVVVGLVISECLFLFMASDTRGNAIRSALLPLCATCLLGFFWRVLLVLTYSTTVNDPNNLREARKRGLSKYDLARLSSFEYSDPSEVSNDHCAICLAGFDHGETLTSLPCDKRHSFHAPCIRQWLERQNSCPLCQRFVN